MNRLFGMTEMQFIWGLQHTAELILHVRDMQYAALEKGINMLI